MAERSGESAEPGRGSIFCFTVGAEIAQVLPLDPEKSCTSVNIGNLAERHPPENPRREYNLSNQWVLMEMLKDDELCLSD